MEVSQGINGPGAAAEAEEMPATGPAPADPARERREALTLLASVVAVAACGLVYELLIATVATYLLGSSVTQFSVAIGVFLGGMGLGSYLSQRVRQGLLDTFLVTELALAALGGGSVALLFATYRAGFLYWLALYGSLIGVGALTGLELPLLTRLLKRYGTLRAVIAQALSFDYVGALAGSLLFPLVLLPTLGMMRTALLVGLVNLAVAGWNVQVFGTQLRHPRKLLTACAGIAAVLAGGFVFSLQVVSLLEGRLYEDEIIHAEQTPHQRIVITRWHDDIRLYLNGHLQFCALDEYRYHEALVHPALALAPAAERVLVLGGGDGLAVREVLKHEGIRQVILVDLDPRMTELGRTFPALADLNQQALHHPRVQIVNADAFRFLQEGAELYDVILADLPDPSADVLAKLYSREFYRLVQRRLAEAGIFATQATSPYFARDAFWCIQATIEAADLKPVPYHVYVPSFGEWGFVLAARHALAPEAAQLRVPTRYLTPEALRGMFALGKDVSRVPVEVSTLDRPVVLTYYLNNSRQLARMEAGGR